MRFLDDEGRVWTVQDVANIPQRMLVEPGHFRSAERYFIAANGEKRLYRFADREVRRPGPEQLGRQLREAQSFAPPRVSDPNLERV